MSFVSSISDRGSAFLSYVCEKAQNIPGITYLSSVKATAAAHVKATTVFVVAQAALVKFEAALLEALRAKGPSSVAAYIAKNSYAEKGLKVATIALINTGIAIAAQADSKLLAVAQLTAVVVAARTLVGKFAYKAAAI